MKEYWKTIVPVVGEPIPDGAQYKAPVQRHWSPQDCTGDFFGAYCHSYEWRVPVPVVPLSVAVDLVAELLRHGFRGVFNVNPNELSCMEEFPEMVTAKLIELAEQEMSNGTH